MKTRKEIGDKRGLRSIYVIECCTSDVGWIPYWNHPGYTSPQEATKAKEEIYHILKGCSKIWTRKSIRVVPYVRAE